MIGSVFCRVVLASDMSCTSSGHGRKGAAAVLEEAGCVRADDKTSNEIIKEMIDKSNFKKEARLRAEREPKINHVLENSQESKMVATISDKLSKQIHNQSEQIELISQRLIWSLRGFGDRLHRNACNIPFTDRSFVKASEHVLHLIVEMRASVNTARTTLMREMQASHKHIHTRVFDPPPPLRPSANSGVSTDLLCFARETRALRIALYGEMHQRYA